MLTLDRTVVTLYDLAHDRSEMMFKLRQRKKNSMKVLKDCPIA